MPTPRSPEVTVDTESIPEHSRLELLSIIYDATGSLLSAARCRGEV